MVTITPEIIQAEIENLEDIIPGQDYHFIILPLQDPKTEAGLLKSEKMLQEERTKAGVTGYAPIVSANPNFPTIKVGMRATPVMREVKPQSRQESITFKPAYTEFTATQPVTEGLVYMAIRNMDCFAFQTNP